MEEEREKIVDISEDEYEIAEAGRGIIGKLKVAGVVLLAAGIIYGVATVGGYFMFKDNNKKKIYNEDEFAIEDDSNYEVVNTVTPIPTASPSATPIVEREVVSIAGSFIDNHNQELYISSKKELEGKDLGNTTEKSTNTKETNTNNKSNSKSTSTKTKSTNNVVVTSSPVPSATPQVNVYGDFDYTPVAGVDYPVNTTYTVDENNNFNPINNESTPVVNITPQPEQTPNVTIEVKYEGYVMRKLNFERNGFWYTPYINGSEIVIDATDMSMVADKSALSYNNSNVLGLSSSNSVAGWEYVCPNNAEYQNLDSVSNLDAVINGLVSADLQYREEADKALTLGK